MGCVELAGFCDSFILEEILLASPPISREHVRDTCLAKNDSCKVVEYYSDFGLGHDSNCT